LHRGAGCIVVHALFPCSGLRSWNSLKRALFRSNPFMPAAVRGPFRRPFRPFVGNRNRQPRTETSENWTLVGDPTEQGGESSRAPIAFMCHHSSRSLNCPRLLCNDSEQVIKRGDMVDQSLGLTNQYCNKQWTEELSSISEPHDLYPGPPLALFLSSSAILE
jgi:hypothetical protein